MQTLMSAYPIKEGGKDADLMLYTYGKYQLIWQTRRKEEKCVVKLREL